MTAAIDNRDLHKHFDHVVDMRREIAAVPGDVTRWPTLTRGKLIGLPAHIRGDGRCVASG